MTSTSEAFGSNSIMKLEEQCQLLITDTFFQFSSQSGIISILLALTFSFYIYYKCPYMVRISGTLCIVSWLSQLLDLENKNVYNDKLEINTFPLISFLSCLTSALQQNRVFLHSAFITALFVRLWWCNKLNLIRDPTNIGFEHLEDKAKGDKNFMKKLMEEYLETRIKIGRSLPGFINGWLPLLESRDLEIGQTKPVFALGQAFAVFRGHDGIVRVLDAYCPHLGANLAVGGKVIGNCIECPFHKWQFNGENGVCTHIPYAKKVPTVGKTKSWLCKEVNGFIYIWHHVENLSPSWEMPEVPDVSNGSLLYRGRTEHTIFTHLQVISENAADISHFSQLHRDSIFDSQSSKGFFQNWMIMRHEWQNPTWEPCTEPEKSHIAKMSFHNFASIFNIPVPLSEIDSDVTQIGLCSVIIHMNTIFGKVVILMNYISEKPFQQKIIHHLYAGPTFPQFVANMVLRFEAVMFERDIVVWQNMKILMNPILIKEDKLISTYRRWCQQFYSKTSTPEEDASEKGIDW